MALKPVNSTIKRPGKMRITKKTASDHIVRTLSLDSMEEAKMINDPDGSIHFLIPASILSRMEIESKLIPYFSNKVVMGGRCRIESIGVDWVAIHLENLPTQKGGNQWNL